MRHRLSACISPASLCLLSLLGWGAALPAVSSAFAEETQPRQYTVECRIVDSSSGKPLSVAAPKVVVFEHKTATITDHVQRPFVVAASPTAEGGQEPAIAVLTEGWTIELTCHASGPGHVTLDLTIEESQVVGVDVREVDDEISIQSPRVKFTKLRKFVTKRPGESFTVALDGKSKATSKRRAEFVITELKEK